MKWPWVSRRAYNDVVAARLEAIASCSRVLAREWKRFDDLSEKYHELARPVTASPAPPALVVDTEPKEVDPVARTIREQAGRDTHLANHLRQYARELRSAGLNDDAIVGKLVEWQTSEPEDHAASA